MGNKDVSKEFSRDPTLEDLLQLCQHLNDAGVEYVIIGGFAIIMSFD